MKLLEITGQHKIDIVKDDKNSVDTIIKTLQSDCKEILSIYRKVNTSSSMSYPKVLYRGEGTTVSFFKNNIWEKRNPIYLNRLVHDATVAASNKLGLKANRENSIFCAKPTVASNWGKSVYAIFPVDGFEVTWFKKKFFKPFEKTYMFDIFNGLENEFAKQKAAKKYSKYKDDSNIHSIKYKDEMGPIIIKLYQSGNDDLKDEFVKYVQEIMLNYKPINGNLEEALNTTHVKEYLISGKSYYGVNTNLLDDNPDLFEKIVNV